MYTIKRKSTFCLIGNGCVVGSTSQNISNLLDVRLMMPNNVRSLSLYDCVAYQKPVKIYTGKDAARKSLADFLELHPEEKLEAHARLVEIFLVGKEHLKLAASTDEKKCVGSHGDVGETRGYCINFSSVRSRYAQFLYHHACKPTHFVPRLKSLNHR